MGDSEMVDPRCNVVLERLLGRAGWAPENLGDHVNRLAASLGVKVRVHRRYPRRWVYAEKDRLTPRIPRDPLPSLVCLLLYQRLGQPITPQMLGWLAGRPRGALRPGRRRATPRLGRRRGDSGPG